MQVFENCNSAQAESALTVNELKEASLLLEINKNPGCHDISFNFLRDSFGPLLTPLMVIFNLSLEKGCFPEELKIARVTPMFKADYVNKLENYKPIPVLPSF